MGYVQLPETYYVSVGDIELVSYDASDHLESTESISGTPTAVEVGSTALTIGSVVISTGTLTIGGRSVSAGQALQFLVSGFTANTTHSILVTADTDATPSNRRFVRQLNIVCV